MSNAEITPQFGPARAVAPRAGVPAKWLESEAKAGRVPCLRAGKRLLFDIDQVVQALKERARNEGEVAHAH